MTNDTSEKFQGRVSREPVVNTGRLICKAKGHKHSPSGFRGGFEAKTDRPSKAEETEVLKIFFPVAAVSGVGVDSNKRSGRPAVNRPTHNETRIFFFSLPVALVLI